MLWGKSQCSKTCFTTHYLENRKIHYELYITVTYTAQARQAGAVLARASFLGGLARLGPLLDLEHARRLLLVGLRFLAPSPCSKKGGEIEAKRVLDTLSLVLLL